MATQCAKDIGELANNSVKTSGQRWYATRSTGANQITTAISQISIATQQNSTASEELYATAEELSHQASQLQEMMEFFKLAQNR